jgi:glycosyltransferase A (GT-A) superfamily protein (DUF2064 family)
MARRASAADGYARGVLSADGCARAGRGSGFPQGAASGSGRPQISKDSVVSSFVALEGCEVVLGPADVGGYYLLGLKEGSHSRGWVPSLFQDIPRNAGNVLEKTLNILKFQSLSYFSRNAFSDAGTQEDNERVGHPEPLNIWE